MVLRAARCQDLSHAQHPGQTRRMGYVVPFCGSCSAVGDYRTDYAGSGSHFLCAQTIPGG